MIEINGIKYSIEKNVKEALDKEVLMEKLTDYFYDYDYIVGDWAYGKLRLKGFNTPENKNYNKINDFKNIDSYINDYCAYGCKHFILKRINIEK